MLKTGSSEYYEIFTQDNIRTWLQRIRHGYLPYLERIDIEGCNVLVVTWKLSNA
jgi:hypothetical protein